MKKFVLGLFLFTLGFISHFILFTITIYRDVETSIILYKNLFLLMSIVGLLICIIECYLERLFYKKNK